MWWTWNYESRTLKLIGFNSLEESIRSSIRRLGKVKLAPCHLSTKVFRTSWCISSK